MPYFGLLLTLAPRGPARPVCPVVRRSRRAGRGAEGGPRGRHLRTPTAGSATARRPAAPRGPSYARWPRAGSSGSAAAPTRSRSCSSRPPRSSTPANAWSSTAVASSRSAAEASAASSTRTPATRSRPGPPTTATTRPRRASSSSTSPSPTANSTGETYEGGGGGAVFVRGGRLKIVDATFAATAATGPGPTSAARPCVPCRSTTAGRCTSSAARSPVAAAATGRRLSSIGVSWVGLQLDLHRQPGDRPRRQPGPPGTPGGGSGGAIYADGNDFTVLVAGSTMTDNHAREGGGAIFFVSNDRTGDLLIRSSKLKGNPSDGFENSPGIFFLGDRQVGSGLVTRSSGELEGRPGLPVVAEPHLRQSRGRCRIGRRDLEAHLGESSPSARDGRPRLTWWAPRSRPSRCPATSPVDDA